jgi:hypothetical protein
LFSGSSFPDFYIQPPDGIRRKKNRIEESMKKMRAITKGIISHPFSKLVIL